MKRFLKVLRKVSSYTPNILVVFVLNAIARLRFDVRIGKGSIVRSGCSFGGNNIIMNNTEVSYSRLGKYTYIANNSTLRFSRIGAYCSIGDNVRTCLGMHPAHLFSTHPQTFSEKPPSGYAWVNHASFAEHKYVDKKERYVAKIGNDVWIGNNVIIMDGVVIGDGVIVAAGAVVTKSLDAYGIYAGVPAKLIKKRFKQKKIDDLLESKWWDMPDHWVIENIDRLNR